MERPILAHSLGGFYPWSVGLCKCVMAGVHAGSREEGGLGHNIPFKGNCSSLDLTS